MVRKLAYSISEREHWVSAMGGLLGILAVVWISHALHFTNGTALVAASIGASAVLLFAVPHAALSQPWPLVGGHALSAFIGVSCAQWVSDPMLAAALAVSCSIAAMFSLRCLHPPGGASALFAVLGGPDIQSLGYAYVLSPVLVNVLILLAIAVAFNYPFAWRRYPQAWQRRAQPSAAEKCVIPHSRLVYALSQIDTFVDISEEDLQRIYELAMHDETRAAQAAGSLAAQSTRA